MAKVLSSFSVTVVGDDNGALVTDKSRITYSVKDSNDPEMRKGGSLVADPIADTDTVSTWWGKVQKQIKAAEGIS